MRSVSRPNSRTVPDATAANAALASRTLGWALHLLVFSSGALALVYEILWMRRFAAIFGATEPAVAATLAAVFLGFTAGSLVIGARAHRIERPMRAYGLLEIGVGLGAALVEPAWKFYDYTYPSLYQALSGSSAGFTATAVSPSSVSGRVVAIVT